MTGKTAACGILAITLTLFLRPVTGNAQEPDLPEILSFVAASAADRAHGIESYEVAIKRTHMHHAEGKQKVSFTDIIQLADRGSKYTSRVVRFETNPSKNYEVRATTNPDYRAYWPTVGNANAYVFDHVSIESPSPESRPHIDPVEQLATDGMSFHLVYPATLLLNQIEWAKQRQAAGEKITWSAAEVREGPDMLAILRLSYGGKDYMEYRIDPSRDFNITHAIMFHEVNGKRQIRQYFCAQLTQHDSGKWFPSSVSHFMFLGQEESPVLQASNTLYSDEFLDSISKVPYLSLSDVFEIEVRSINQSFPASRFEWTALGAPAETTIIRTDTAGRSAIYKASNGMLLPLEFAQDSASGVLDDPELISGLDAATQTNQPSIPTRSVPSSTSESFGALEFVLGTSLIFAGIGLIYFLRRK